MLSTAVCATALGVLVLLQTSQPPNRRLGNNASLLSTTSTSFYVHAGAGAPPGDGPCPGHVPAAHDAAGALQWGFLACCCCWGLHTCCYCGGSCLPARDGVSRASLWVLGIARHGVPACPWPAGCTPSHYSPALGLRCLLQMAMQQQQQMAMSQQQQMQQPLAAIAPQQSVQPPAMQGGDAQAQHAQAQHVQVQQVQAQPLAQAASGALPTASSAGELQPAGGSGAQQQQQADAAQQAQQAQQAAAAQAASQQAASQQAQQAQQGAVVPPGMMLVPIPAGGAPAMPAQPYPAAHPYYGMKAEASLDPGMAPSGSGAVSMAAGGYMAAPAGMAPGMGVAAVPAVGSLPQVMPPNAPPVSWLPAPDISQDGKLRPPAA